MPLHCKCWVEQRELWQGFSPPTTSMTGHAEAQPGAAGGSGKDQAVVQARFDRFFSTR